MSAVGDRYRPGVRGAPAPADEAGDLFRAALDELSRSTLATEQARTSLLYGEWLRRARRRRDARPPLQDALETFDAVGAERFASRAAPSWLRPASRQSGDLGFLRGQDRRGGRPTTFAARRG